MQKVVYKLISLEPDIDIDRVLTPGWRDALCDADWITKCSFFPVRMLFGIERTVIDAPDN